ncbi:MAG: hypothetical protein Q9223_007891, partial [Gallowayella weberi]
MGSATRQPRPRIYQEDFEAATRQIDEAIQQGLPNAAPDYDTVAVLMIHWSNDNIGVQPLEEALAGVFRTSYHFHVETHVIQAYANTSAEQRLQQCLLTFSM